MIFEDFVAIHKDKTPMEKLGLLFINIDIYAHDRAMSSYYAAKYSVDNADYYNRESDQIQKRLLWLQDELKMILGGNE